MPLQLPIILPFLGAFAALGVVVIGLIVDRRRVNRTCHEVREAAARTTSVLKAFDAAWLVRPDAATGWTANDRLADWLQCDKSEALRRVLEAAPEIDGLAQDGTPFEKTVELDGLWLHLTGRTVDQAGQAVPFVRLTDVSAEIQERQILLDERQRLRTAIDTNSQVLELLPFPLWQRDAGGTITWANSAYAEAVGATDAAEVVDKQTELTTGAAAGALKAEAESALQSGEPRQDKHFIIMGDQRRAMRIRTLPLARRAGTVSFAADVSEIEDLSNELGRLTDAQKEILNTMTSAVAIFQPDKTLDYFNQAFAQLWRLPEDWLATHPHHGDIFDAMREQRSLPEQVNFKSWKEERLGQYKDVIEPSEEYWHLPDGRTLRVVTHSHPMGGILQHFEDVTDRLAMERSFNTLIAVQRETLNKLHEGVAVFSSDGLLKLFNPAYATLWHLDIGQLEGGPHVSRILDLCASLFEGEKDMAELSAIILGGHERREVRHGRLRRSDGTVLDYATVPLPDGGTLLTYMDVTDQLRIENALIERNEALEAADRLKSEFVAHVSYELRTPINSIIGFSEILEAEHFGALNEKQKEYVADIATASKSLRALINDILDLSMIEAGVMHLDTSKVNIREVLNEVVNISAAEIDDKSLACAISCPRNVGSIEGDRGRLVQIVYNLVSNAIKYTPEGGSVTVGARRSKDTVQLFVEDNGVGISAEEQDNVFDKFNTGTRDPKSGVGLGLSLVRRFVEMHHGEVVLESEEGKGTRVTCSLPRSQVEAAAASTNWQKSGQSEQPHSSTLH